MVFKVISALALVAVVSAGVIPAAPIAYHAGAAPVYAHAAPVAPVAQVAYAAPIAKAVVTKAIDADYDPNPQYSYSYDVQDAITGDNKQQQESRNGDAVQGSYSFIESDGSRRIVEYTADPVNGFNAIVHKEAGTVAVKTAAAVAPVVPVAPAAPAAPVAPAIPASGPDSDVEVVEARSGPLRSAPTARDATPKAFTPARLVASAPAAPLAPVRAVAAPLKYAAYAAPAPVVAAPFAKISALSYATYPAYSAYTAAYSSPFAYSAPAAGLTYAPAAL
ncbi:cuticle protein 21-like isoform X1 [Diprion similis]|uniref:cuticle protein 21-like isoform X1 n=1 Tax=Diprion similis TaxID=362088 RepID=UPI001EF9897F|nr:cuticle protein 21-like isoform X1 [Diprion similis]